MEIPWLEPFRTAVAMEAQTGRPLVVALATVDEAGDPQVRSVVCRRVDDHGALWIARDARSAKHRQLARHPRAAAVAWFPAAREQFRFNGSVQILGASSDGTDRVDFWRTLSPETRATFLWPEPEKPRTVADEAFTRLSDAIDPPPSFEVLKFNATVVDHLLLASHPHRRRQWTLKRAWDARDLNP